MEYKIRRIEAKDLPGVVALARNLWPASSPDELLTEFQDQLTDDRQTTFICCNEENAALAFATVSLRSDYVEGTVTSPVGYLEGIYVLPRFRKKRIALKLLSAAEQWSKTRGCREFASDAELDNHLSHHFHLSVGFTEVNRIVCYSKLLT